MSYFISVYFDRWETIRLIKKKYEYIEYDFKLNKFLLDDYYDFSILFKNDKWNQYIFQKIITAQIKNLKSLRKNIFK